MQASSPFTLPEIKGLKNMRDTTGKAKGRCLPWSGFPIPKLDMLSQLGGGEEQWVPDPPDLEERDILKVTYTGDDV